MPGLGLAISPAFGGAAGTAIGRSGGTTALNNIMAIGGDSRPHLTNGPQNSPAYMCANGFPTWIRRYLPGQVDFNRGMVFAVPNTAIADFVNDQMTPLLASSASYAVLLDDINGIDDPGNSLALEKAAYDTVVAAFKAAGKKLFVGDGLPVGSTGAAATWQAGLRDYIRTLHDPVHGIYVAHTWNALATVPDGHTAIAGAFPVSDPVHPNATGCAIIGRVFANLMASVLPANDLFAPAKLWGGDYTGNGGTVTAPATGVAVDGHTLLKTAGTGTIVGAVEDAGGLHWQTITMDGTDALAFGFNSPELISYVTPGTTYLDLFVKIKIPAGGVGLNRLRLYALTTGGAALYLGDGTGAYDGLADANDVYPSDAQEFTLRLPHVLVPAGTTTFKLRIEGSSKASTICQTVIKCAYGALRAYTGTMTEAPLLCGDISDLAGSVDDSDSVTLTFSSSANASSHQERHSLAGQNDWSTPATVTSGGSVAGLAANTAYDFQVRGSNVFGQGNWSNTVTKTTDASSYVFTNTEASDLCARFTTPATEARKALIDTFVGSLKSAGVWTKLDFLHVMAAETAQAAQRNWIADQYNLSLIDAPTFTADRGYAGDGVNDGLDTGVNASALTQFTQNDCSIGAWAQQSGTAALRIMGLLSGTNLQLGNNQGATERFSRINSTTSETSDDNTTTGLISAARAASGTGRSYRNGASLVTGASTSSARASSHIVYLQNNGGAFHDGRIALGFAGANLDDTAMLALYNAAYTYLHAIGAA